MANYANLIQQINASIKTNGANLITGQMLQTILDNMVASLGANYQYAGVATPATNPGTPDQNVFYLAATAGTYTNFGGLVVAEGEVAALKYNGAWAKDTTEAASLEKVNQLGQNMNDTDYIRVICDAENKLLIGIKENGDIVLGYGLPTQIREILELLFVEKENGKTLTPTQYIQEVNDEEYLFVLIDANDKILAGIKVDGTLVAPGFDYSEIKQQIHELYYHEKTDNIISQNPEDQLLPKIDNLLRGYRSSTSGSVQDAKVLCLLHFSDIHNYVGNMEQIAAFVQKYSDKITDIIHTGDLESDSLDDLISDKWGAKWLNVIGNHDAVKIISGNAVIQPAVDSYNKIFAPFIANWGVTEHPTNATYYYKDYDSEKVRLIVLDNYVDGDNVNNHWSATQQAWFESALAGTLDENDAAYGYHIVVAVHYPPFIITKEANNPFQGLDKTISSGQICVSAIPECVATFISNGGKFACYICGHTHYDFVGVNDNYPGQFAVTIGGSLTPSVAIRWDEGARVPGTKTQYLFNLLGVDTSRSIVKVLRIGSNMDRYMRVKNTFCYDYENKSYIKIN